MYFRFIQRFQTLFCVRIGHIDAEVAAVMSAKAENINGLFEGEAILDIDCTAETGATYYTEVPAWKKQKNFTKEQKLSASLKLRWEIEF